MTSDGDGEDRGAPPDDSLTAMRGQFDRWRRKAEPRARELIERGGEAARTAQTGARERLDAGVAAVTAAEWREEVEEMLSDITGVLLAMDARITALERQRDE